MKTWKFKKGINNVIVTVNDNEEIIVTINNDVKVNAWAHAKEPVLEFRDDVQLIRDGKKFWCKGFSIDPEMHKAIKEELQNLKKEAEKQYKIAYDAYLSGEKQIKLYEYEPEDFLFVTEYYVEDEIAKEVLKDLNCLSGGLESLKNELKEKIKQDCTIDIKDCIAFNKAFEEKRKKELQQKIDQEMQTPAIQTIMQDDEENELKIGDILHKNGCIYIIDEIVEDIDYPELKACTCHRKEN